MKIQVNSKRILADTLTPVSAYLKFRELFPQSILLESSDYHSTENACSFICLTPIAGFIADEGVIKVNYNGEQIADVQVNSHKQMAEELNQFYKSFSFQDEAAKISANGIFGYLSFDAIKYFEKLEVNAPRKVEYAIPEVRYHLYKHILAIDHHKNTVTIIENLPEGCSSELNRMESLLKKLSFEDSKFKTVGEEQSNVTDQEYKELVSKGISHCKRGDVFQIVLSRQFSQGFEGDDLMLYRALRSVNPSPYLFYFDYGCYRIFGSSPEAELRIQNQKAIINPIAGTFRRTGNDEQDAILAQKLGEDPKENAEHVMLVDLARNDLSRNAQSVQVDSFREVQYFSHVIHLVSEVSGRLDKGSNMISVLGDSFPAGTLSGAPKHMALKLIDKYENQRRSYYGGTIGFIGFDDSLNHAIMIRSFLSKNNRLFYQAGAGIVANSVEENELQEVNNKLAALKRAIEEAEKL
ncbi:MAG: anthranilate synthase component I family protein [Mangrovibacterium sp.]